jgi:hypothetical protein
MGILFPKKSSRFGTGVSQKRRAGRVWSLGGTLAFTRGFQQIRNRQSRPRRDALQYSPRVWSRIFPCLAVGINRSRFVVMAKGMSFRNSTCARNMLKASLVFLGFLLGNDLWTYGNKSIGPRGFFGGEILVPAARQRPSKPCWRAMLCLARASLASPFGPSTMCFLHTARCFGCRRSLFPRAARPLLPHAKSHEKSQEILE